MLKSYKYNHTVILRKMMPYWERR